MKGKALFVAILMLFVVSQDCFAGILAARRPGTEAPVYNLRISRIRTTVNITGQLAVTHVDEEFHNDQSMILEGFYAFQLPEGAKVDGLWLWVDGKRLIFVVKEKAEAERLYDSVVVGTRRDPAILESLGANRFQLKIFPINPRSSRRIELRYFHTLPLTETGYVHYRYPLDLTGYQDEPVENTDMTINVNSQLPITDFNTSFDDEPLINRVTQLDDFRYHVEFGLENVHYEEDYTLSYKPEGIFDLFPTLAWHDPDEGGADPYFMTWHPVSQESQTTGKRDIVFVLDASGSMVGQRIATVRDAVTNILQGLDSTSRIRIVLFSTNTVTYPQTDELVSATPGNIAGAIDFIDRLYQASGNTNYEIAFRAGLSADFRHDADKKLVFLTDGYPNRGVQSTQQLMEVIETTDQYGVAIHPVLFYTPQIQQLYDIAELRGGKTQIVEDGDNLQNVISRILFDLQVNGLYNVDVQYNNGLTYFVYPSEFPAVVTSDQLITTGRYTGTGQETATVTWESSGGQPESMTRGVHFESTIVDVKQVGAYWAAKRIDELLKEIKILGETDELVNSIINLSIKHSILTPYTAFLVLETNPIDPPPTSVDGIGALAESFALSQNYPNPFSLSGGGFTTLSYELGAQSLVKIVVTDILGREIAVLVNGTKNTGSHTITWDGRMATGELVQPGVYFVRMVAGDVVRTIRITVIR